MDGIINNNELKKQLKEFGYIYTDEDIAIDKILIKSYASREKIKLFKIIDEIEKNGHKIKYFK